ncbi:hypothetical protein [Methylobacterium durans]|uniref:Uncharacterized protein n=1 Tax=Methylobacterium durans TaxID=2202825 RepID=A0A2U8WAS5_9HYPH|nr:hypothetical protein [Methylobacterium durans]AWN42402.1 hypothetical protein DK389_20255 [Methylobacterium durans]
MSDLPLTVDLAGDAFIFPAASATVATVLRPAPMPRPPEPARGRKPGRWLLWLIGVQIAASVCLTTYVAYAMAPALARPLPEAAIYALRLGAETSEPLPAALNDGFRLRLSFHEAAE